MRTAGRFGHPLDIRAGLYQADHTPSALLWLIHDGRSGQCNPAYATIAEKAGCAPSTVGEAIKALEAAGILSWVNRIHRVATRERDLFGHWATTWRVLRTSNAYVFHDPKLAEQEGHPSNTEFPCGPLDDYKKRSGARLVAARVTQTSALQGERGNEAGAQLSPAERAALIARLDTKPTKADWALYGRQLEVMLAAATCCETTREPPPQARKGGGPTLPSSGAVSQ